MRYECFNGIHLVYLFILILPVIALWAIIVPLYLLRNLYKNRKNLMKITVRFRFGFLFEMYRKDLYYWEFIRMYMRLAIVVIVTYLKSKYSKVILVFFILLVY